VREIEQVLLCKN